MKGLTIAALLLGGLTACGGGGDDEAGAPVALNIQPSTVSFQTPKTDANGTPIPAGLCLAGGSAVIYVYGGAAPYRIDNTASDVLVTDVTTVSDRGGHFTVTVAQGGCLDPGLIVVTDKLNNQVVLTVKNLPNG